MAKLEDILKTTYREKIWTNCATSSLALILSAVIDIDAPETPSWTFGLRLCQGHHRNGRRDQDAERKFYHVTERWSTRSPRRRGHHPLSRRRVFGLGARGLQLEGHRQPVRHLQPG